MRIEFWSNTELTSFMTGLLRDLRKSGHDAVHRFQISNIGYRRARGTPARLWLRVQMYLIYPLRVLASFTFRRGPALSVISTNTFFAPLLATFVAGRRRKVVHLVYDLFPDVLVHAGSIRRGGVADRVIGFFTRMTFRRCAANVFLGRRLLEYAEKRYGKIPNAVIIPVGADGQPFLQSGGAVFGPVPDTSRNGDAPATLACTILYCGNMGRMHDTSTLAEVLLGAPAPSAQAESLPPLHFLFHASGPGYAKLKDTLGLPPGGRAVKFPNGMSATFAGGLSDSEWETVMRSADVALVTMTPGAEEVVMPSKTYSAMAAGQAILAVGPHGSDLADVVLEHDCGWLVAPGDAGGLQNVLDEIQTQPERVMEKRRNAFRAGHACYGTAVVARMWEALAPPPA